MGTHRTDFREYARGQRPGDFTARWRDTAARVEGALTDLPHRNHLSVFGPTGNGQSALSWNAPDADAGHGTQAMRALFRGVTQTAGGADPTMATFLLRGSGTATAPSAYRVVLFVDGSAWLSKLNAGVNTNLATTTGLAIRSGAFLWLLFEATGTTVRFRVWSDGDTEPGTWTLSATDATFSDGWMGAGAFYPDLRFDVLFLGIGTNGDAAPLMSSLPRPLDVWSQDPTAQIAFTAEWPHYNPATDAVERKWTVTPNYVLATGPSDYPPNQPFLNVLTDPGSVGMRLEGDVDFGGFELRSTQSITLDNSLGGGTEGPLDDWVDRSFSGFPVIVRAGEVGQPHRAFEVVYPATVNKEPDVGPSTVVAFVNPAGSVLEETLEVRRYIGIPTAPMMLTNTGRVTAPHIAAYNVTSFLVFGFFKIAAATAQDQVLALKEVSSANRNFVVRMVTTTDATNAGKLTCKASIGGVNTVFHLSAARYDDGQRHAFAWGLRDGAESFLLVDDVVVSEIIPAGSVDVQTAPFVWGAQMAPSGLEFGVGLINEYRTPDQARSLLAIRLTGEEPGVAGYWPGDDLTGSAETDYSPNANHGALAGTDGIDYLRSPTDAGMPEQAGRPMPLTLGVVFNARGELQDSIRNRFRTNDRTNPAGTALSVKARGLLITGGGTDYTDVGDGVVDMATPQSEPVTFDLDPLAGAESQALHVPRVVGDAIALRRSLGTDRIDADAFAALRQLFPYRGGAAYREPPTVAALMKLLGTLGAHGRLDRDARMAAGALLPKINPGPYGRESLLEFLGSPQRGVTFSAHTAYDLNQAGSFGIAAWIKFHRAPWRDRSAALGTYLPTGMTLIDRVDGAKGYYLGIDGRDGSVVWGAPGVTATVGGLHYLSFAYPFLSDEWYFIFTSQDGNTRSIRVAPLSDPIIGIRASQEKSELTTGTMTVPTGAPLRIGHGPRGTFCGSIAYVILSSWAYSIGDFFDTSGADAFNIKATRWGPDEPSGQWPQTRFYARLNEGSVAGEAVYDEVNARYGRIEGARWCPRLVLDFRSSATQAFSGLRRSRPVWRADARYKANGSPVTGADVASTVLPAERIALGAPYLSQPDADRDIREDYRQAREIILDTALAAPDAALEVASRVRSRFDPEARSGEAKGWWHAALRLMLTDEVRVFHDRWGLDEGWDMRVHSLVHALANSGESEGPKTDIGAWGAEE